MSAALLYCKKRVSQETTTALSLTESTSLTHSLSMIEPSFHIQGVAASMLPTVHEDRELDFDDFVPPPNHHQTSQQLNNNSNLPSLLTEQNILRTSHIRQEQYSRRAEGHHRPYLHTSYVTVSTQESERQSSSEAMTDDTCSVSDANS